ncbi:MAG: hypothetical protein AB4042_21490 [Leptolyngbyaceae cyanobacterium]
MNVLSPFDETVRDLSLAQHLPRIKKLLVYVCTQHWESDPAGLASYHLHELVQQLVQIAPTFEGLKAHLNGMTQTLNKPGEYTLVNNTILRNLQRLYPDAVVHTSPHYQSLYRVAADQLALDDDPVRVKKLLYFVCRGQWTQDLAQVELLELVAELHSLTPTSQELTTIFDSVVQNVSKPQKYQAIAQRIIHGLAPLYHPATHAVMAPTPPLAPVAVPASATPPAVSPASVTVLQQGCGQPVANPLEQTVANPGMVQPSPQVRVRVSPPLPPTSTIPAPIPQPEAINQPTAISIRQRLSTLAMDDWFTMRVEIHKFANPLLAKYLLFMHSYADAVGSKHESRPDQWDRLTWDGLKNTDLDTLLRDGLKSCRTIGEFERSLKRTTRQLNTPNQYKPIISAILRAIHPLFANCTAKESNMQQLSGPPANMVNCVERRSLSPQVPQPSSQPLPPPLPQPSLQPQPHIPHYQKDAAEKHTLLEVHPHVSQQVSSSETQTFAPLVASAAPPTASATLEQTESDSKFDTTEAEVTGQSQGQPSASQVLPKAPLEETAFLVEQSPTPKAAPKMTSEETAFLVEQDRKLEQRRDTAFLAAQSGPSNASETTASRSNTDETIGIPLPPPDPDRPFDPFGVNAAADDPADETIAMPMH